jgi:uncharacterized protein YjbI with pentapeptide repeats
MSNLTVSEARAILTRDPADRAADGIQPEDVEAALLTVLRDGVGDEKTFEGCQFPELSLDFEVVHGADNHPAIFENCTFEGGISAEKADVDIALQFHDCTVGGLSLYHARFEYDVEFHGSRFAGPVTADETRFDQDAEFDGAVFEAPVEFVETSFHDDTSFADARFTGTASFQGSQFEGDSNELEDHVTFAGATFEASATFQQVHFEANQFDGATFRETARFTDAVFDHDTEFEAATFEGDAHFEEIECDDDADFAGTTFGGDADFSGAVFRGGARTLEDDASFAGATFAGGADFGNVEFRQASFEGASFEGDAGFGETWFHGDADFSGVRFGGVAGFDETRFHAEVDFSEGVFAGPARFRGAVFEGEAGQRERDVSFAAARFEDDASFSGARFQSVSFVETAFAGVVDFTGASLDRADFLVRSSTETAYVDLTDASLRGGSITQPAEGWVRYDLTRVSLGDIDLSAERPEDHRQLFDYFRFCETLFDEFDGNEFDFEAHTDYLDRNDWVLHEFDDPTDRTYDVEMTPEAVESTYLRAKNSASVAGDMKAAGEFRVKRQQSARRKHLAIATDGGVDAGSRVRNGVRAAENAFLGATCGYGMRIFRIFGVFALVPALFSLFYAFGGPVFATSAARPSSVTAALLTPEGQAAFFKLVSFSYITFLTIGYGNVGPVGWGARVLVALEVYLSVILGGLVLYALIKRSEI